MPESRLLEHPWTFLDKFRGTFFSGTWPTLPELFRITAERFPRRPCFTIFEDGQRQRLDYSEALQKIGNVAALLRERGVLDGEKVALTGKNTPSWAIAYFGVLWAGCTVVPLDHQLKTEEVLKLMDSGDVVALIADEEKFADLKRSRPKLKTAISLSSECGDWVMDLPERKFSETPASRSENDLAAILFTSGTTGAPKGAMLSHANLVSDCFLAQSLMPIFSTDVFYALLPIHHAYTMLAVFLEAISVGAEILFAKKMAVSQIVRDFREGRVTMFLGVPLLFNKILSGILAAVRKRGPLVLALVRTLMVVSGLIKKTTGVNPGKRLFKSLLDQAGLSELRICISGAGPLAPSVFRQYNQLGLDFVQGYGLTETSPILTLNPVDHYKESSVGRVIPQTEMKILEPDELGQGEIAVRGPMVMQGYYKNSEDTAKVLDPDGWFRTGDVGILDSENYLCLTGRRKSVIVTSGGKNVYPEEIEFAFQLFSEVEQVLVRGYLTDPETRAESVEALIFPNQDFVTAQNKKLGSDRAGESIRHVIGKIVEQVNATLRPSQRISRFEVLTAELEMTTTRKIKRF